MTKPREKSDNSNRSLLTGIWALSDEGFKTIARNIFTNRGQNEEFKRRATY